MVFHGLESRAEAALRERAESALAGGAEFDFSFGGLESSKLVHELEVREVELHMQNQALLEALHEAEVYRAKYHDLYESAPVAYVGVRQDGTIVRLNRCAVALLGGSAGLKSELIGQSVMGFATAESASRLQALLAQTFSSGGGDVHSEQFELRSQLVLPVFVDARAQAYHPVGSNELHVRLVLTDVTALCMAKDDVVRHMMKLGD